MAALPLTSSIPIALSGLLLAGQDILVFLSIGPNGDFSFLPSAAPGEKASRFMPVNQAWTIGIEIAFYALVPLLVRRRNRWLCLLLLSSLALRHIAYLNGLNYDPWNYRFFPFELAFFLVGMLGYRFYAYVLKMQNHPGYTTLGWALAGLLFIVTLNIS